MNCRRNFSFTKVQKAGDSLLNLALGFKYLKFDEKLDFGLDYK